MMIMMIMMVCVCVVVVMCVYGDRMVSLVLRKLCVSWLKVQQVRWSVGSFSMAELQFGDKLLQLVNSSVLAPMLPMEITRLRLQEFRFQLPLMEMLNPSRKNNSTNFCGLVVRGLQVEVKVHSHSKWDVFSVENRERKHQAIKEAFANRMKIANSWFDAIEKKRLAFIKRKEAMKKEVSAKKETVNVDKKDDGKSGKTMPRWKKTVDLLIERFEILVESISFKVQWDEKDTLGIDFEKFHVNAAKNLEENDKNDKKEKDCLLPIRRRPIELSSFGIYLNTKDCSLTCKHQYILVPFTIKMNFTMPQVMGGLLSNSDKSELHELKNISIEILLDDVTLQLQPIQVVSLMSLLKPISAHQKWQDFAVAFDRHSCIELSESEKEEYISNYLAHYEFSKKTNFLKRKLNCWTRKAELLKRESLLSSFDKRLDAKSIVKLRCQSLAWDIPSFGKAAPFVNPSEKCDADFEKFLVNPVDSYFPKVELAPSPPLVHGIDVLFKLGKLSVEPQSNEGNVLLEFSVCEFSLTSRVALLQQDKKQDQDKVVSLSILIDRFSLFDTQNNPCNVFRSILDRNIDAKHVFTLDFGLLANNQIDVGIVFADFSFLFILDPFVIAASKYQAAFEESADNIVGDDEYEPTPEEMHELEVIEKFEANKVSSNGKIIYEKDIPQEYTGLLLGGIPLRVNVVFDGWEFCVLGNPKSLTSHVLAFTSNVHLMISSEVNKEKICLQLVDVALQPCKISITDEALDLEIPGLRTIIELEGEGVDFQLNYEYEVINPKSRKTVKEIEALNHQSSQPKEAESKESISSHTSKWLSVSNAVKDKQLVSQTEATNSTQHPVVTRESTQDIRILELDSHGLIKNENSNPSRNASSPEYLYDGFRKVAVEVSDLALNFSKDDLSVFINISQAVNQALASTIDDEKLKIRQEKEKNIEMMKQRNEAKKHRDHLKRKFMEMDVDHGGSLDSDEVFSLVKQALGEKVTYLTIEELNSAVQSFISLVDKDGSGDISYEEFSEALEPNVIHYSTIHTGVLSITAGEFVNKNMYSIHEMPSLSKTTILNTASLVKFWEIYETGTGCTKESLCNNSALNVQKKMVKIYQNYDYAREAWNRIINPSLKISGEKSKWLLTRNSIIQGRENIIDLLISSIHDADKAASQMSGKHSECQISPQTMFVKTIVQTKFGGIYIRIIDILLPLDTPSIEFVVEDISASGHLSLWEGDSEDANMEKDNIRQSPDRARKVNSGYSRFFFTIYGKYYNTHVRQLEPFLEPYHGLLVVDQLPQSNLSIDYSSDKYFQLNITQAFMDTIKSDITNFMSVSSESNKVRTHPHIQELGGLFYLKNESGIDLKYSIETEHISGFIESCGSTDSAKSPNDTTDAVLVNPDEYNPCILKNAEEERLREHKEASAKEKELRAAFHAADTDGSGELESVEVRYVLEQVLTSNEVNTEGSSAKKQMTAEEMSSYVDAFMRLADTDGSGEVSWDEFKVAMNKMRATSKRFLKIEFDGYKPISSVPIDMLGTVLVYELIPSFDICSRKIIQDDDIEQVYELGKRLLNQSEKPNSKNISQAKYCFEKVVSINPMFKWCKSYLKQCNKMHVPELVAIDFNADGNLGMLITVSSGFGIKNCTEKLTQVMLTGTDKVASKCNPRQVDEKTKDVQYFFNVDAETILPVPINLVENGFFTIRQVGEVEWSNFVKLSTSCKLSSSIHDTEDSDDTDEDDEASETASISASSSERMKRNSSSKNGRKIDIDHGSFIPGKELFHGSNVTVDDQPTNIIEKISSSPSGLSQWFIGFYPQLIFENQLPYALEYKIVQRNDIPLEGKLQAINTGSKKVESDLVQKSQNWFQYVDEVNSRCGIVSSGEKIQVSGLNLEEPAFLKIRVLPVSKKEEYFNSNELEVAKLWSSPYIIHLHKKQTEFHDKHLDINIIKGPSLSLHQTWLEGSARTLSLYCPYWIQNKSGLDLKYKVSKGNILDEEEHNAYFGITRETVTCLPRLLNSPTKAKLSILPYQESLHNFDEVNFNFGDNDVVKYLPEFSKLHWSNLFEINKAGTSGELYSSHHGYVLAYDIVVAPSQFNKTKIIRFYPRYVISNNLQRSLHITPVNLDSSRSYKLSHQEVNAKINGRLEKNTSMVIYRFFGSVKKETGFRLRDITLDEEFPSPSDWLVDSFTDSGTETIMWLRGQQKNAPLINIYTQQLNQTKFATITDISKSPAYRIENRSTKFNLRYVQAGVARAEEMIVKKMEWHSFAWQNPFENLELRVMPEDRSQSVVVNILELKKLEPISLGGGKENVLYAEVYIEGAVRVLSFIDAPIYNEQRQLLKNSNLLKNISVNLGLYGFGLTLVDAQPKEIMNLTVEKIQFFSKADSNALTFKIHHFQIDDMTPNSAYPKLFAPLDTGYNSDRREEWRTGDKETPFLYYSIDISSSDSQLMLFEDFTLKIGSMLMQINFDYLLLLVDVISHFVPQSTEKQLLEQGIQANHDILMQSLSLPDVTGSGALFYFKNWSWDGFEFHLVFNSNPDSAGSGISSILGDTLGSIVGGIAHITPEFQFKPIEYNNRFFYSNELIYSVVEKIVYAVLGQLYKVLGSVEMLGDPVGLCADIAGGVALAVRQTKRDIAGKSDKKGKGAATLLQAVIGAPADAVGKATNGMGDVLKRATYFEDQEDESNPRHIPQGLYQGGKLFGKSLIHGVSGLAVKPYKGAKENGVKGFGKGIGKGAVTLVACPFVGILGAIEKVSQSVHNNTHIMDDEVYTGARRPARDLITAPLKALEESNLITEMEIHIVSGSGFPADSNPRVYVNLIKKTPNISDEGIEKVQVLDKFSTTKKRHTGNPKWDESRLMDITSVGDTYLRFEVYHKRKPLPKKLLGVLELSIEDVFNMFDPIPGTMLEEKHVIPKARELLKSRDVHRGSIYEQFSTAIVEHGDTSKPIETVLENFDDWSQEDMLMSQDISQPLKLQPVSIEKLKMSEKTFKLANSTCNAELTISIKFVNDMRK